jgi:anti-sigma-K factor RskA
MNESNQDQATLYALGLLETEESLNFEQMMATDPDLERLVRELQDTVAETVRALPCEPAPPPALRRELMNQVHQRKIGAPPPPISAPRPRRSIWAEVGWGIAAALAVAAAWLFAEHGRLQRSMAVIAENELVVRSQASAAEQASMQLRAELDKAKALLAETQAQIATTQIALAKLTEETNTLRQRDARAQMQIATLQSTVDEYRQGVAVVVWDSEKHQGILKLEKMPPVDVTKDYQLWVVDPANPKPVNAGVVKVDAEGFATIEFKPVLEVSSAAKFALSVEKQGGVAENEGPIVLIGP